MADSQATLEPENWESYLRNFHHDTPRATELAMGLFADARGRSSYARLAATLDRMPRPQSLSVLDLGCGDGRLIDDIRAVCGGDAAVSAIDLSAEEISRAKAWGRHADFTVGRAQELPYEDNTFDAVLSHFSFMLMVPIEPVVREIERVLKPQGYFAAALSSLTSVRGDFADVLNAFREERDAAPYKSGRPGFDPRQSTATGIAELFKEAGSVRQMRHEGMPFGTGADADAAWLYVSTLYGFDDLDEAGRERLRERIRAIAAARNGKLTLQMTIDLIGLVPHRNFAPPR